MVVVEGLGAMSQEAVPQQQTAQGSRPRVGTPSPGRNILAGTQGINRTQVDKVWRGAVGKEKGLDRGLWCE